MSDHQQSDPFDIKKANKQLEELLAKNKQAVKQLKERLPGDYRIMVNKRTHRVRFIEETEDQVTVIIEKKGSKQ